MAHNAAADVLIIGAGPAGLAAACCAAEDGRRVLVVDDNPAAGGQIWRGAASSSAGANPEAMAWIERARRAGVEFAYGSQVFDAPEPGVLLADRGGALERFAYEKLILATGARERFLPLPGWTLPGVLGAGGLQSLVKSGLPIDGKRVLVAGSGPLLLAVAAYLHTHGAQVVAIAEQASRWRLAKFAASLAFSHGDKLRQALQLRRTLRGILYRDGCWPVRFDGRDRVSSATLTDGRQKWNVPCELVACGFGLVPNLELATLLGCAIANGRVQVDGWQQTSQPGVYSAGEANGIGGLEQALVEGQIAAHAAAGNTEAAYALFAARTLSRDFARRLDAAFALRPELRSLATADTIVCRCEDVPHAALVPHADWRAAKLHTRCGMGPCQGRVCGPAVEFLYGWETASIRPPIFPVPLGHLQ
jgi:NADPH-dependent 2,4-dienoyl-CoA reductase/sulfur reductase-like enzyme